MNVEPDRQVSMTVDELEKALATRGEAAQAVAVVGTCLLILGSNWLGFRWAAHVLLAVAAGRIIWRWRSEKPGGGPVR